MAGYVGWTGYAGATPVNLAECKVYDSAAEAWDALYADMEAFGWSHVLDDPEDPEGPQSLSPAAVAVQDMERQNRAGTVRVGLSVWAVEYLDDDDID